MCGVANKQQDRGMFCLRCDDQFKNVVDSVLLDPNAAIAVAGIAEGNNDTSTIICGEYNGILNSGILYVSKVDTFANIGVPIPFNNYDNYGRFRSIEKTRDGGYILAATVNQLADQALMFSYAKLYLLKLDSNLNQQWFSQFNSLNAYTGVSATQTSDGGYLMSGYEHTASYDYTMVMIKTDAYGSIVQK
jgi:hypothetical protein